MLSKNKIKFINALKKKKDRYEKALFTAEGAKLVEELLQAGFQAELLCAEAKWLEQHRLSLPTNIKEPIEVSESELGKISGLSTPQQVLAVFHMPVYPLKEEELLGGLTLVVDRVQDPGNMGTIIRTADWFGIGHIICSEDAVDVYNPKTIQATMGSIGRVKVFYKPLNSWLASVRNRHPDLPVYGTFLEGENLYTAPLESRGLIIMGSESHGISAELHPFISRRLYIPAFNGISGKAAESLNVSMATGIVCAEFRRRQWEAAGHSK